MYPSLPAVATPCRSPLLRFPLLIAPCCFHALHGSGLCLDPPYSPLPIRDRSVASCPATDRTPPATTALLPCCADPFPDPSPHVFASFVVVSLSLPTLWCRFAGFPVTDPAASCFRYPYPTFPCQYHPPCATPVALPHPLPFIIPLHLFVFALLGCLRWSPQAGWPCARPCLDGVSGVVPKKTSATAVLTPARLRRRVSAVALTLTNWLFSLFFLFFFSSSFFVSFRAWMACGCPRSHRG